MNKKSEMAKRHRKMKDFNFVIKILIFFIFIGGIAVSCVFSTMYLTNNSKLNIDFAGGNQVEVTYDGIYKSKPEETNKVIKLLENRVDALGTSNIDLKKISGENNKYTVTVSKSANLSQEQLINNTERRGYLYLVDENGHDLLAQSYSSDKKTWATRDKRLILTNAFSEIKQDTNPNSHQPELDLKIKDSTLSDEITSITKDQTNHVYLYSDIGQVLNFARNNYSTLKDLVNTIANAPKEKQAGLKALLASNTPGFSSDDGSAIYNAVVNNNRSLQNLLNHTINGIDTMNWIYSDVPDADKPLSVDPNDEKNVFDPGNPFQIGKAGSPMNAWLAQINNLVQISDLSKFFDTTIINNQYAAYFVGKIDSAISNGLIRINDDAFNQEKVRQISSLLNAGMAKNNFYIDSYSNVAPTFGANALKIAIVGLLVALVIASILVMIKYRFLGFYAILMALAFLCFTLVMFTFLNNIFSPETGIALIISFALLLDAIVGLLTRFQAEFKTGKTVFNAFKTANKKSTSAAFDGNIIVLIFSLTIFWFGTRSIKGFAIMTSLATFGVIVFGILLFRIGLYFLLKHRFFENRPHLLALYSQSEIDNRTKKIAHKSGFKIMHFFTIPIKKFQVLISKPVFHPSQWNFWHQITKWVIAIFGIILIGSSVTYLANGVNFGEGFDSKISLIGTATYSADPGNPSYNINNEMNKLQNATVDALNNHNQKYIDVASSYILNSIDGFHDVIRLIVRTNLTNSEQAAALQQFLAGNVGQLAWTYDKYNSLSGNQLFINMIIALAISLIAIFIYVIIRFQLTFTIPLIIAMIFGALLTVLTVALFQVTISTMIVGVVLGAVTLVLINSVVIFDNIKELKLHKDHKQNHLSKLEIVEIANESIKKSLSRTLSINSIIILASLLVMLFIPSFWAVSVAIMIGTISAFVASHFVAPWAWTFFERWRIKRAKKRIEKIKKNFVAADEYIISGIND